MKRTIEEGAYLFAVYIGIPGGLHNSDDPLYVVAPNVESAAIRVDKWMKDCGTDDDDEMVISVRLVGSFILASKECVISDGNIDYIMEVEDKE